VIGIKQFDMLMHNELAKRRLCLAVIRNTFYSRSRVWSCGARGSNFKRLRDHCARCKSNCVLKFPASFVKPSLCLLLKRNLAYFFNLLSYLAAMLIFLPLQIDVFYQSLINKIVYAP